MIFTSLFKGSYRVITAAELLAEIGDCRGRYPSRDALAGDAGQAAVAIKIPASAKPRAFVGAATSGCAQRSARWLTAPATGTPGPKISTPPPAPVVTTTPVRYAPSDVPGAGSSGSAGKTACLTTLPATARYNDTSLSLSPTPSGPVPDLAATQRMAGAAVAPKSGPQSRARSA